MELRQLEYFCAAAKHEHISKAAEALFISQPALSRTIRNLEEELGVSLFEPAGRGIRLTSYGTYFYSVATHVLDTLQAAQHRLKFQSIPNTDRLYVNNLIPELFPYLLRSFFKDYPGIPIFESTASREDVLEGAENTQSGCILSYQPTKIRGFQSECIAESPYVLLLPAAHRLSRLKVVSLSELGGEAHIAYSALRLPEFFESALPYPNYLISDLPSVIRLVSQNYGLAILPNIFLKSMMPESTILYTPKQMPVALSIRDCSEVLRIYAALPQSDSFGVYDDIFLRYCRKFFVSMEDG